MGQNGFIERLYDHLNSHYNPGTEELTIVFPNKRAAFYLRDAFKQYCTQTIWLPQMISIEEAVTQWSGITLADSLDLLFELIDIDAQLHRNQEYTSDLSTFGSQAAQMAKDFDEIDQYGIDAKAVFNFVVENKRMGLLDLELARNNEKEQKYLHFFLSLYDYYLKLRERLAEQGKGYYGMITRHLSELPEQALVDSLGERRVIFAGFNALTTTEERIINTLIRNGKAEILFDYDKYYVDDPNNKAGLFARRYLQTHPEWLTRGISDTLSTENKTIHIISSGGNAMQAKALQSKLQEKEDRDTAIILADEKMLIPILNAIPDTEAYKSFNVSMGYPVKSTPVNQLVTFIFSIRRRKSITREINDKGKIHIAQGWYIWYVLHLMDLEIVKITFPKNEIDTFNTWKNKVVKEGKFIFEASDYEALEAAHHLQELLKAILTDLEDITPQSVLRNLSIVLALLAEVINTKEDKESFYFLLNQISEIGKIVSRLQQVASDNNHYIKDLQSIEILYRLLVSGATLKLNSNTTDGLQIMGLLETRNIDLKRLHILSVNEGILPKEKPQGSFIPQYIRHAFGLPDYAKSQAVTAYHFYRLLQNGEDIYLYYNNLDDTSGGEASRYILQIKHELAKNANISVTEESFGCTAKPVAEAKAVTAAKDDIMDELQHMIQEKGLSPSSLSTYTNCPLKYYLKYVEKIKSDSLDEEIGSDVTGNIIHDTLEFLFQDYRPQDDRIQIVDKPLFDNVIKPQWKAKLDQAIAERQPRGFSDIGFNYLKIVNIRQQIERYLKQTSEQLEHSTLTIIKTEDELETTLPTVNGDCRFYGRTDRIDQFDGITRVIDYKTGRVTDKDVTVPARLPEESDLEYIKRIPEKALQLLIYKYLYLKTTPNMTPDKVTAAIHGLKYKRIEFNLGFQKTETPFLSDDTFIDDMEALLKAVVNELLDKDIPFVQAEDDKKCSYCDFKRICKRDKKN